MTPFELYKVCQYHNGIKYRGKLTDFEQLGCHEYFCSLNKFLIHKFGKKNSAHKEYISVCAKKFGSRFSPFDLMTTEYYDEFQKWYEINNSPEAYKKHVTKSLQYIFDFCVERKIYDLKAYARFWSVTHILSDKLNENVAYLLGVHELRFTKPEKTIMRKSFLKNVKIIKERLENNKEFYDYLKNQISKMQKRLTEIKSLTDKKMAI